MSLGIYWLSVLNDRKIKGYRIEVSTKVINSFLQLTFPASQEKDIKYKNK